MSTIHPTFWFLICLVNAVATADVPCTINAGRVPEQPCAFWGLESHNWRANLVGPDDQAYLNKGHGCAERSNTREGLLGLANGSETTETSGRSRTLEPEEVQKGCFRCHAWKEHKGADKKAKPIPSINVSDFRISVHSELSCLSCHPDAARLPHGRQAAVACIECHQHHPAKVAHDVHLSVSCQACHLAGIDLVRDKESGLVIGRVKRERSRPSQVHDVVPVDCHRCHFKGNRLGTAAIVLPAKSVLCLPCHPATLSLVDTVTVVSLIVFAVGIVGLIFVLLSAPLREEEGETGVAGKICRLAATVVKSVFSVKIVSIIEALFLDAFLQRRLYSQSRRRWFMHALIFYPFVFRFLWGLFALASSCLWPQWSGTWVMLDQNHPLTAFVFDITGAMVIAGIGIALVRRALGKSREVPGLPAQDIPALVLIACVILTGFIVEGMRIGMNGAPPGTGYAVLGYAVSGFFSKLSDLTEVYGYMWYCHAGFVGLLVAYLPFSRMMHMFAAPIVLAVRAAAEP